MAVSTWLCSRYWPPPCRNIITFSSTAAHASHFTFQGLTAGQLAMVAAVATRIQAKSGTEVRLQAQAERATQEAMQLLHAGAAYTAAWRLVQVSGGCQEAVLVWHTRRLLQMPAATPWACPFCLLAHMQRQAAAGSMLVLFFGDAWPSKHGFSSG